MAKSKMMHVESKHQIDCFLDNYKKTNLFYRDQSANDRIAHVFRSLYGYFIDGGLFHGFHGWRAFAETNIQSLEYFKNNPYLSLSRVLSTMGIVLFELDFFGLFFLLYIYYLIIRAFPKDKPQSILLTLVVIIYKVGHQNSTRQL